MPFSSSPFSPTDRIQEELSQELGHERAPNLADRGRLPYTDAFLHEVQRFLALLPMGVPRALTKPTSFRGYDLPQVNVRESLGGRGRGKTTLIRLGQREERKPSPRQEGTGKASQRR